MFFPHAEQVEIDKYNLLFHYSEARKEAFKVETIQASFRKTGIWPLSEAAIPVSAFEPSKNFSTQPDEQPMPAILPAILIPQHPPAAFTSLTPTTLTGTSTPDTATSHASSSTSSSVTSASPSTMSPSTPTISSPSTPPRVATPDQAGAAQALYCLALPSLLKGPPSHEALAEENAQLRYIAEMAGIELEMNHAQLQLMGCENTRLRNQIFAKKSKPKRSYTTGQTHLLTGPEMMAALLHDEHVKSMKVLKKEMVLRFHAIKKVENLLHMCNITNTLVQALTKAKAVISGPHDYGRDPGVGVGPAPARGQGRA
jgi:hypothetical protein